MRTRMIRRIVPSDMSLILAAVNSPPRRIAETASESKELNFPGAGKFHRAVVKFERVDSAGW
jgi:hypothetical protein